MILGRLRVRKVQFHEQEEITKAKIICAKVERDGIEALDRVNEFESQETGPPINEHFNFWNAIVGEEAKVPRPACARLDNSDGTTNKRARYP